MAPLYGAQGAETGFACAAQRVPQGRRNGDTKSMFAYTRALTGPTIRCHTSGQNSLPTACGLRRRRLLLVG